MPEKKTFRSGLLCGLLLAILIIGSIYTGKEIYMMLRYQRMQETQAEAADAVVNSATMTKMQVVKDTIDQYYLEAIDEKDMTDGVYEGMVEALGDPYSTYYSAEELQVIQQQNEGIYYGIGAYIGRDQSMDLPLITGVMENTPAQESGLQYGDIICAVDGVEVTGMDNTEVVQMIKGEEGTYVNITIYRAGEPDYLHIDVERKKIESPTVEHEMYDNGIGYIQIKEFDDVTMDQFTEALAVCKGSGMTGLILDLRSNPGGNLTTVTEIARMILPKGLIVYTQDKAGEREEYTCDGKNEIQIPIVVLINGHSASASEILAGAIKDYGKGTLLGTTTFGKGIVQRIIGLTDGSAVKVTVSHYYTPSGKDIHNVGIEPDEELEFDAEAYLADGTDNQLERAKAILLGK